MNNWRISNKRIAFVGASCSGKTSVFTRLKDRINVDSKINVYFANEAATDILRNTDEHPHKDPVSFQCRVSMLQFSRESFSRFSDNSMPNLCLTDRGVLDAFVYLPNDAESLLDQDLNTLLKRYDYVLYFLPFHTDNIKENNEYRYETRDELSKLDTKTYAVWSKHPHILTVPVFDTIENKTAFVARLINNLLEEEIFDANLA